MRLTRERLPAGPSILRYQPEPRSGRPTVLLIHGLTASAAGLDHLAAYLATRGFPVTSLDLPGHPLGATGGTLDSFQHAVETTLQVLDTLPPPVVVGGHSFGGGCAAAAATQRKVAGLFLVAVAPVAALVPGASPLVARMQSQRAGYVDGAPLDTLLGEMRELMLGPLHTLAGLPVLAVGARQDIVIQPADVEKWKDRLPHIALEFVEGSHQDAPTNGRVHIWRWLERLGAPP
ncbi:MAG TPA: alpha/beta fold hydrolase [Candidatus Xenobia bacterium]